MSISVAEVREEFSVLRRKWQGDPIIYFDNAATSLKPKSVVDAMVGYMTEYSANIHRGNHVLSQEASEAFESARAKVARFIHAPVDSVVFVRGTTDAANLVAAGLGLERGDNVVGTVAEHHSNILPWSSRCEYRGAPLDTDGLPSLRHAEALIDGKTRLLTVTGCSNVTGICPPIRAWVDLAHRRDIPIFVDAAQLCGHEPIDVVALGVDFLAVSGHKICGPTGAGFLYGQRDRLEALRVSTIGGGAVNLVRDDFSFEPRETPLRFESGTPDIAAIIGMGAALDFLSDLGMEQIAARNGELSTYLYDRLAELDGVEVLFPQAPPGARRAPIIALRERTGTFPPDFLSRVLSDSYGVMTRHGHHCAHPLHHHVEWNGTLRASLQFYNTLEEIDRFARSLERAVKLAASTAR